MAGGCCFQMSAEARRDKSWRLNRRLLPVKGFYFVFFAAVGSLLPFIAVYMKHLGLTSNETGIIYGVMPFLSFLVRPMVGAIADRWQQHKLVLIVCTVLTSALHFIILFVPPRGAVPSTVHVRPALLHCQSEGSVLTSCLPRPGKWNESWYESALWDAEHSGCSVSLEKLTQTLSRARMFDAGMNDMHKSVNGVASHYNETGTFPLLNSISQKNQRNILSLMCRRLSSSGSQNSASSPDFCFKNEEDKKNYTSRCQRLQNNSHPLNINILNVERIFTLEPETLPDQERISVKDCNDTYHLNDLESYGQTYTRLVCPESPTTMLCEMRSTDSTMVQRMCGTMGVEDAVRMDLTFGLLMVTSFFATAAFSPVFSLMDAITFDQLGDQRHKYGQQRMWGTLGLAALAITTTFTINPGRDDNANVTTTTTTTSPDNNDDDDVNNYDVMFYLFSGLSLLAALIAAISLRVSVGVRCQSMVKNACRLLLLPEVLAFLGVVLYLGMVTGAIEGFLFWYLADLGAPPLLFGLCLVVNCAFEIPFFFFSGALLKRLSPVVCLYCSMLVLSVRLMSYSLLSDPWLVLLAESLHGVTFGVMWAAVVNHADVISPPGMSASVQGVVGGVNSGVGKGVGSLLTGVLFSCIGERWTFRALALTCLTLLILYFLLNTFAFPRRSGSPRQNTRNPEVEAGSQGEEACQKEQMVDHTTNAVI